ncbi:MAG: ABC transporter permease, partial [Proteobacteria bacterium]|nr:ABC transporter permease [Pseudomonadota bacterium]
MLALLSTFSWQELRHHPWRNAAAVVAVMLGVALAFSVQLINASALVEFTAAVRSVDGRPDLTLRAARGTFDDRLFARVAQAPQVALASPVLELSTYAVTPAGRVPLRVLGVDALVVAQLAPALLPRPRDGADRLSMLTPGNVFLNASARTALRSAGGTVPATLELQSGLALRQVRVAGSVAAGGAPLAVMDIAAAQVLFGQLGLLTRIDLRLVPGTDRAAFVRSLALPGDVTASDAGDALARADTVSRAYRVNLTVLALVALFTGAFLVYSVLALGVAKRGPQFALLAVLGLTARERL